MPDAHSPFHAPVGSGSEPTSGFVTAPPEGVRQLFDEVDALALRLRQSERLTVSEDDSVIAGQHVLQILAEKDGQTVPQIARVRATSRQNIQIVVNRLKARGCVEVLGNPAHKRSPLVRLTDRGRDLLAKALAEHEKLRAGIAARISGKDIDEMLKVLRQVRELLGAESMPSKSAQQFRP